MKNLLLLALLVVPGTAFGVENQEKYDAYKQRRASRHASALAARRAYNATRAPAVYGRTLAVRGPMTMLAGIEEGWVRQPAIPMRPIVSLGVNNTVYPVPYVTPEYTRATRVHALAKLNR